MDIRRELDRIIHIHGNGKIVPVRIHFDRKQEGDFLLLTVLCFSRRKDKHNNSCGNGLYSDHACPQSPHAKSRCQKPDEADRKYQSLEKRHDRGKPLPFDGLEVIAHDVEESQSRIGQNIQADRLDTGNHRQ